MFDILLLFDGAGAKKSICLLLFRLVSIRQSGVKKKVPRGGTSITHLLSGIHTSNITERERGGEVPKSLQVPLLKFKNRLKTK